jgi:hypothetical protein
MSWMWMGDFGYFYYAQYKFRMSDVGYFDFAQYKFRILQWGVGNGEAAGVGFWAASPGTS